MVKYEVISGEYKGRIGIGTLPNYLGLVMFYPQEGQYPYRVCLSKNILRKL